LLARLKIWRNMFPRPRYVDLGSKKSIFPPITSRINAESRHETFQHYKLAWENLGKNNAKSIATQRRRLCVHPEDDYFSISSYHMFYVHTHPRFHRLFPSFAELLRVIPTLEVTVVDWILFAVCQDWATARIFKSLSWSLEFFQELKHVHLVQLKAFERLRPSGSYQLKLESGKIKILDAFRLVFEQQHQTWELGRVISVLPSSNPPGYYPGRFCTGWV
jgi:hypothetical protein